MKKQYKDIIFWIGTALYLIIVLSFVSRKTDAEYCVSVNLKMVGETQNYFVDKHDVMDIIKENNGTVLGQNMGNIDVRSIEETLEHHSSIKKAEAYKEANGVVSILIEQRKPLIRIIDKHNNSFYIDEEGFVMSVSKKFTARVPIASGNISADWEKAENHYLAELINSKDSLAIKQLNNLYKLARFIQADKFWTNQIQQVYYDENKEIELIPRIGAHIIKFGHADRVSEKFRNLRALYNKAFRQIGWNQYRIINLKFKNQIICKKRNP